MFSFDSNKYGPVVADLLADDRISELGPGRPSRDVHSRLKELTSRDIVTNASSQEMAECCLSGLWLWHDYLDESHAISQDLHSAEGSYWHGIMHRREPDYSNAKYWYRRVGHHPIFEPLAECLVDLSTEFDLDSSAQTLASAWDPNAFVDLCAQVARGKSQSSDFCRQVATLEWQLLFDYCFEQASGN